jgi:hypothetical protein
MNRKHQKHRGCFFSRSTFLQMLGRSAVRAGLTEEEWCNCWVSVVDSILQTCKAEGAECTLQAPAVQSMLSMVSLYHNSKQLIHSIIKFYSTAERQGVCWVASGWYSGQPTVDLLIGCCTWASTTTQT